MPFSLIPQTCWQHALAGNLVVYNIATGAVPWASGTANRHGVTLTMQQDCNLVILTATGGPVWSSGSNVRR